MVGTQIDQLMQVHDASARVASNAVEMVELSKSFGVLQAVDRLTLTVQRGEIFGLLGPNGSGKTTTINMMCGLVEPTSGDVRVLGFPVRAHLRQVRQLLGVVPQETALYEELTAWDNLDFHADLFGIARGEKRERITQMLKLVELWERKGARVSTFSGGMKRRLAIARALVHAPALIYLDEPTLGVDVQSRRAIWEYIRAASAQGRTVLLSTNYLEEAQALCDRIAILDQGHLIAVDTPEHLKQTYGGSVIDLETEAALAPRALEEMRAIEGVERVEQTGAHLKVSTRGASALAPLVLNIVSRESALLDLVVHESQLEEIFLRLTGTAFRE